MGFSSGKFATLLLLISNPDAYCVLIFCKTFIKLVALASHRIIRSLVFFLLTSIYSQLYQIIFVDDIISLSLT